MIDDTHANSGSGWNGDSLQLAFTNSERNAPADQMHMYNYGMADASVDQGLFQLQSGTDVSAAAIQRFDGTQSTVYEIKILAAEAGLDRVTQGATFGFALCSNDGDEAVLGESEQSGQKGWSGWGPYAIVFGKNSASAGLVTLVPFKVSVTGPRIKRGKG